MMMMCQDVERSDFFRYMVLLRYGGVYADIDTESRQPVDSLLKPEDTLVVGWENEWPTQSSAFDHHYVRRRQVLQWVIMAAPGHPVLREVCDFIAKNAFNTFSNNTNRDTLERTGPGIWTDIVLRHAVLSPSHEWPVRILPRVAFGVNPKDPLDAVPPDHGDIAVLHHFLGTWKVRGGWKKNPSFTSMITSLWTRRMVSADTNTEEVVKDSGTLHFPVSAQFEPPFTAFVQLVGQGSQDLGNQDVSSEITIWCVAPTRVELPPPPPPPPSPPSPWAHSLWHRSMRDPLSPHPLLPSLLQHPLSPLQSTPCPLLLPPLPFPLQSPPFSFSPLLQHPSQLCSDPTNDLSPLMLCLSLSPV